ncbi:MAG TPA: alpha-L-fucosidase [Cytophagaceae bacterium]|jgi:alpha-L-fucosidase
MNIKVLNKVIFPVMFILIIACSGNNNKQIEMPDHATAKEKPNPALTDWQNQKFSMFIHFGVYSVPAGVWKSQKIEGYNEQIRAHGKISREEYRDLAKTFNPSKWNPDSVVSLAKAAGMKSIVITSKHHDGFAMFHTKQSDFNIVDFTPYKRDIIKELSNACKKQDLKFGVYFSLIDWDFPGALPISSNNSDSIPPSHHELNLNQVKELMTNYGPISEIWFDMGKPTLEQSKELASLVRKHQPNCLISGRIWNGQGDFAVMGDNEAPDFRLGVPWQTIASFFWETWGYRSWQVREDVNKKAVEKLHTLLKVVSNGGKFMLNIGPMGNGEVVPYEKQILTMLGEWIKKNGEAVYGTSPSPLPRQKWGVTTIKNQSLYLFVLNAPQDGKILIEGLESTPKKAYLASDHSKSFNIKKHEGGYQLDISGSPSNDIVPAIVLEYEGQLQYTPSKMIARSEQGPYELTLDNGIKYHSYDGPEYYSAKPTVVALEWFIRPEETNYKLFIQSLPNDKGKKVKIYINGEELESSLEGAPNQSLNKELALKNGQVNSIKIALASPLNKHSDIGAEGLVLRIIKE